MIKKYLAALSLAALSFFAHTNLQAQQGELYAMGLPDEPDLDYDLIPVQVPMTSSIYRGLEPRASVKQYAPVARSQGQYGTCAAWATAYAARTILEAQRLGITDKKKIDELIFSYGFAYRVNSNYASCNGAYPSRIIASMKEIGTPYYKDYTIHCPQTAIPQSVYNLAAKNKIKDYSRLWDENYNNNAKQRIEAAKLSLANGHPVVIAMICPSSLHYLNGKELWTPLASEKPNSIYDHGHGRHAVCVVSYDDEKYGGAFEIQNSWGANWGKDGYVWIRYSDFVNFVYQAYEMKSLDPVTKDVKLSGAFNLVVDSGQEMIPLLQKDGTFKIDRAYRSGTRFRMYIDNNEPAYVYAFGMDGTNQTYQIFPYADDISPLINYKKSQVAIPGESKHVRMDNTVGTDYFCVLYSKEALDLAAIQRKIRSLDANMSMKDKLKSVLGNKLIVNPNMSVENKSKMSFNASSSNGGTVVAIITALQHI